MPRKKRRRRRKRVKYEQFVSDLVSKEDSNILNKKDNNENSINIDSNCIPNKIQLKNAHQRSTITSVVFDDNNNQNGCNINTDGRKEGNDCSIDNKYKKYQLLNKRGILRTSNISQRLPSSLISRKKPILPSIHLHDNQSSVLSPAFSSTHSPFTFQHLSPFSTPPMMLKRTSTSDHSSKTGNGSPFCLTPISHTQSICTADECFTPKSILKSSESPSFDSLAMEQLERSVSFGSVEIHEFPMKAGTESDGVPSFGAFSLHLSTEESKSDVINIEDYEQKRYERLFDRAKNIEHWSNKRLQKAKENPMNYLRTAGNISPLTPKERQRLICSNSNVKQYKKRNAEMIAEENKELQFIRQSRNSNDIYCNCKPLSKYTIAELKDICEQYEIPLADKMVGDVCMKNSYRKKKRKNRKRNRKSFQNKGYLIGQILLKINGNDHYSGRNSSRISFNNCDKVCCWSEKVCSCFASGIECHSGKDFNHLQCGCIKYHKRCKNEFGRYECREAKYSSAIIDEWNFYYRRNKSEFRTGIKPRTLSF